jgi:rhamnulokinase
MSPRIYLAIDLGASSGRVMAGRFDGRRLRLEEVHRFGNAGCHLPDGWHWEITGLFAEIKKGLAAAGARYGRALVSAGVDTWGVDYGLLDGRGRLLGLPYMYRDDRTAGVPERVFRRVSRARVYAITGVQSMFFNTLYQLCAERASQSVALAQARHLLFTPDLLHYWLSGRMANEYTIASTSQMLDARRRTWARGLIRRLGLPGRLFGDLVEPGTELGPLRPVFQKELGLGRLRIVVPGSHDTASAVAAVPAEGADFAYLSSGTWSLLGAERERPLLTPEAMALNFTNEGGVGGTIRLLKNITGLWLLQECRRVWNERGAGLAFTDIERRASRARPFRSIIDPDDPAFGAPGDMPARIAAFCRRTRQPVPAGPAETGRVVYESLALRYRNVFDKLVRLTGRDYATLHIVGGGSQNHLLNQLAADAVQRPVVSGPAEATAIGNILLQMKAAGDIGSLAEGRALVRASFPTRTYEPRAAGPWDEAYARFRKVAAP